MKRVINISDAAIELVAKDGDTCTVQPGENPVEDKFTVNLPPKILLKGGK